MPDNDNPLVDNPGYSPVEGGGIQRTECDCTNCLKKFVAELDFDIDGEHIIECPHCGHEHCRKIEKGKVTEIRWSHVQKTNEKDSSWTDGVIRAKTWKSGVIAARTSSVSAYIRERWLNRSDCNGT